MGVDGRWQGEVETKVEVLQKDVAEIIKEAKAMENRLSLQLADIRAEFLKLADAQRTFMHRLMYAVVLIIALGTPGAATSIKAILLP